MGWTGEYFYGTIRYAEEKRRVAAVYTWDREGFEVRPLMMCNVRPNWFVAVEVIAPASHDPHPYVAETLPDGRIRYVYAEVMMTRKYRNEWMRKEVSEGSGPTVAEAPAALLAILSPLKPPSGAEWDSAKWAAEWRERCKQYAARVSAARRLKEGESIRFAAPIRFSNGVHADTFRRSGKASIFYAGDMRVCIPLSALVAREWSRVA